MKSLLSISCIALALSSMLLSSAASAISPSSGRRVKVEALPDTVLYQINGYRRGWTEKDWEQYSPADSSTVRQRSSLDLSSYLRSAADSSLSALSDSLGNLAGSLGAGGEAAVDDSLLAELLLEQERERFRAWYDSLSDKERREYDREQRRIERERLKDSLETIKDSIAKNKPRILESGFISPDWYYQKTMKWTVDTRHHNVTPSLPDTSFNYHFDDYRFMKGTVGATWLGVSGSVVRPLDYLRQEGTEHVSFYDPLETWSYSHQTLPMYNTKVPYTELSYTGTLFSGTDKEEDNVHVLTTTNYTPELNFALSYDRNGANGILMNEKTASRNVWGSLNYLGQRYLAHLGLIHHSVDRQENGGILDNFWIRDTLVDQREIMVALSGATSSVTKNTFFLDQQYGVPFAKGTIFAGHSSEYSSYVRTYEDKINYHSGSAHDFYGGNYFIHPTTSFDRLSLTRIDNGVFAKYSSDSRDDFISNISAGAGYLYQKFYGMDPSFLSNAGGSSWHSLYIDGAADGEIFRGLTWDAFGKLFAIGKQAGDFTLDASLKYSFYPFRRARTSPVTFKAAFSSTLTEPEHYTQHLLVNHFKWDNDFSKTSVSRVRASVDIPNWRLRAEAGYSLIAGAIYYGSDMNVAQKQGVVSVAGASLNSDLSLLKNFLHLEHRLLFQLSSDQEVMPLPLGSFNLRYYVQIPVKNVMDLQIGANALYNTSWYTPGYNPALGVFYNQREETYNNGPYVDAFLNARWSTCSIFVKYENATSGRIISNHDDYFSAHHYINTAKTIKIGIFWPFSASPSKNGAAASTTPSSSSPASGGGSGRSSQKAREVSGLL